MRKGKESAQPAALEFETLRAASGGDYLGTRLYTLGQGGGVYRRVPRSGAGRQVKRPGAFLARFGSGVVELVACPALDAELRAAGLTRAEPAGPPPAPEPPPEQPGLFDGVEPDEMPPPRRQAAGFPDTVLGDAEPAGEFRQAAENTHERPLTAAELLRQQTQTGVEGEGAPG